MVIYLTPIGRQSVMCIELENSFPTVLSRNINAFHMGTSRHPCYSLYFFEEKDGKSHVLNRGITVSGGDTIAFLDDDVIVDKNWLTNIWKCFKQYNCDAVGGRILPLYPKKTPRWAIENKDLLSGPIVRHDYGEETKIY